MYGIMYNMFIISYSRLVYDGYAKSVAVSTFLAFFWGGEIVCVKTHKVLTCNKSPYGQELY